MNTAAYQTRSALEEIYRLLASARAGSDTVRTDEVRQEMNALLEFLPPAGTQEQTIAGFVTEARDRLQTGNQVLVADRIRLALKHLALIECVA